MEAARDPKEPENTTVSALLQPATAGIQDMLGLLQPVSIGRPLDPVFGLDNSAIRCVKEWRFAPGTRFGKPIPVLVAIELTFTLR